MNSSNLRIQFNAYLAHVGSGIQDYLVQGARPYQDFLNDILRFYIFMSFLVDSGKLPPGKEIAPLMSLYSKAGLSLFGVIICLQNGLVSEASILLRPIFENLVTVETIVQNTAYQSMGLYCGYEDVLKWMNLEENKKLVTEGKAEAEQFKLFFTPERQKEVQARYEAIKHNYHPKKPHHWAWRIFKNELKGGNPSIRFLARKLSLDEEYLRVYSSSSLMVHCAPQIKNIMIYNDSISLAPDFSDLIYTMGIKGLQYSCSIVKAIILFIEPQGATEMTEFVDHFLTAVCIRVRDRGQIA